ncbi:hypothetical protein DKX38_000414 [Salix brachista]|uniref:DUF1664 domain-containing protein n=1 Tax=Salix brachista TaxID=2182728 RepID=A0A5N5P0G2_9ROSI|nr:hypothetical protein DKX38_000414 [Salix brachista]
MAIPLGKLTILVGAGILGSVLAKEGRMPDVSGFVSGAFKIALRQLKGDDSTSSVSKSSKPPNDSLMAQVTSLRHELQMLASSRPVTIVTANGTGLGFDPSLASETGDEYLISQWYAVTDSHFNHRLKLSYDVLHLCCEHEFPFTCLLPFNFQFRKFTSLKCIWILNCGNKYGVAVVVIVVGYGYVWWKGWKLPDMMFATRRSLSDACTSIGQQLEDVYGSIRSTRRHLSSKIDGVDTNLNAIAELTASTQERVTELREDSSSIGNDVRNVRDAVETLELKISRIEGKQVIIISTSYADLTTLGVKRLCDYASSLENNLLEENVQACYVSFQFGANILIKVPTVFTSFCLVINQAGALPAPSSEPSTPSALNESSEVQRLPRNAALASSQQGSTGISGVAEVASSLGISNGTQTPEATSNGTTWFKPAFLMRTRSAINSVVQQTSSSKQQS